MHVLNIRDCDFTSLLIVCSNIPLKIIIRIG